MASTFAHLIVLAACWTVNPCVSLQQLFHYPCDGWSWRLHSAPLAGLQRALAIVPQWTPSHFPASPSITPMTSKPAIKTIQTTDLLHSFLDGPFQCRHLFHKKRHLRFLLLPLFFSKRRRCAKSSYIHTVSKLPWCAYRQDGSQSRRRGHGCGCMDCCTHSSHILKQPLAFHHLRSQNLLP